MNNEQETTFEERIKARIAVREKLGMSADQFQAYKNRETKFKECRQWLTLTVEAWSVLLGAKLTNTMNHRIENSNCLNDCLAIRNDLQRALENIEANIGNVGKTR